MVLSTLLGRRQSPTKPTSVPGRDLILQRLEDLRAAVAELAEIAQQTSHCTELAAAGQDILDPTRRVADELLRLERRRGEAARTISRLRAVVTADVSRVQREHAADLLRRHKLAHTQYRAMLDRHRAATDRREVVVREKYWGDQIAEAEADLADRATDLTDATVSLGQLEAELCTWTLEVLGLPAKPGKLVVTPAERLDVSQQRVPAVIRLADDLHVTDLHCWPGIGTPVPAAMEASARAALDEGRLEPAKT